jgi:hypothetical protein
VRPGHTESDPAVNTAARPKIVLVLAVLTALALYPAQGLYVAILGGGWVASFTGAILWVPDLGATRWAQRASIKTDPVRMAFASAVNEDVIPMVDRAIARSLSNMDTQIQRVESRLVAIDAEGRTRIDGLAAQQHDQVMAISNQMEPLTRRVTIKTPEGTKEAVALDLTIRSIVDSVNDLVNFITAPDGLAAMLNAAVSEAALSDHARQMGAKGQEAMRASAEALGNQAAEQIRYLQTHPEIVDQGQELKQTEDAIEEVLGMLGAPEGGAIRAWAKRQAVRNLMAGGAPAAAPRMTPGGVGRIRGPVPL